MLLLEILALLVVPKLAKCITPADLGLRQCELIRIDMCRGIGYNETTIPNLIGRELQSDVELTLQTFAPLIEYVCSTQLKLFLCAAYVPMCTPKVPEPIGPCRSLCESVRSRCHPVLQGFGFSWPPALDCSRFPKENNHETMCMEGPGEMHSSITGGELHNDGNATKAPVYNPTLVCPNMYRKLYRSSRCAPLCDADILFEQHDKHLAEVWVATWAYAAIGLAVVVTLCMILTDETKTSCKWLYMLTPLVWCHNMVAVGWTVRFTTGRTATACGYDPQVPNVSLLLVDGLSNASCAATFLMRYYFGMAACAWWAILCFGWHRDVRRNSPDAHGNVVLGSTAYDTNLNGKRNLISSHKREHSITNSNLARFVAWGLPAFQTAAVIVARLVDADELLGACFVGNQSDKGLQVFVATPLFCYWIFGSMNLISGFLVHRRNKEILNGTNATSLQQHLYTKNCTSGIGTFLSIYCAPCSLLLLAVIYEFANIDVWLNSSLYLTAAESMSTPLWPFLSRAFMELMLGIICFAWVLGPKISTIYKRKMTTRPAKQATPISVAVQHCRPSSHHSNVVYSTPSYQTVRHYPLLSFAPRHSSGALPMNQMSNYSFGKSKYPTSMPAQLYVNHCKLKHGVQNFNRYGNETIL